MTTIAQLISEHEILKRVSDSARRDVEILLCHCLQKNTGYLVAWPEVEVCETLVDHFRSLLARRVRGEPIAYLVGQQGFWTLDLLVSPATLIPRPETELLVEHILDMYSGSEEKRILDLGTGTGAIALALASERPDWHIVACDIECAAIELAKRNQTRALPSPNNVSFLQSNWFDNIEFQSFNIIVSNPPYIDPEDPHLQRGDVRFEPSAALISQHKGLADIEKIISQAPQFLTNTGWLLFEHGFDQGVNVRELLNSGGFDKVFTRQDLAGLDRISCGQLREAYDASTGDVR